jgi:pimeloyl-ACP methyl ester carboxylesterase
VLLLSGESDPFADLALLRRAVDRLPRAELHTYAGVGHGLAAVLDRALDEVASFLERHT